MTLVIKLEWLGESKCLQTDTLFEKNLSQLLNVLRPARMSGTLCQLGCLLLPNMFCNPQGSPLLAKKIVLQPLEICIAPRKGSFGASRDLYCFPKITLKPKGYEHKASVLLAFLALLTQDPL